MDPCLQKVVEYLKGKGAQIAFLSVDEHDRAMAVVQAMHHFATLSFLYALTTQLRKFSEPHKLLTRSLKLTLKSAGNLLKNMDTVTSIQQFNPYAKGMRATYLRLISVLNKKDSKEISAGIRAEIQKLPLQKMAKMR
jgi:prephenate dehydrogenase